MAKNAFWLLKHRKENSMSKAEDLSRQYVLPFLDKHYEKYGEHKQMELTRFDGYDIMSAYEEGYYQAEKDLELTWEDIEKIDDIALRLNASAESRDMSYQEFCQEVLKRFKEQKGE